MNAFIRVLLPGWRSFFVSLYAEFWPPGKHLRASQSQHYQASSTERRTPLNGWSHHCGGKNVEENSKQRKHLSIVFHTCVQSLADLIAVTHCLTACFVALKLFFSVDKCLQQTPALVDLYSFQHTFCFRQEKKKRVWVKNNLVHSIITYNCSKNTWLIIEWRGEKALRQAAVGTWTKDFLTKRTLCLTCSGLKQACPFVISHCHSCS